MFLVGKRKAEEGEGGGGEWEGRRPRESQNPIGSKQTETCHREKKKEKLKN
jgi:hypothetical protein